MRLALEPVAGNDGLRGILREAPILRRKETQEEDGSFARGDDLHMTATRAEAARRERATSGGGAGLPALSLWALRLHRARGGRRTRRAACAGRGRSAARARRGTRPRGAARGRGRGRR